MVVAVAAPAPPPPPPPPAPHPPSPRKRRHSSSGGGDRPPPRRPVSSGGASAAAAPEAAAWFVREATPQQRHRRFFDTAAARKTRLREQQVEAENRLSKLRSVWMNGLSGGGGGSVGDDDAFAADEAEDGGCLVAPSCPPSAQHPHPPPPLSSSRPPAATTAARSDAGAGGSCGVGEMRRQRRADVETIRPAKQRPASAAAGVGAGAASSLVANAEAAAAAAASAAAASAASSSAIPLLPGETGVFGWDVTEEPPLPALLNGGNTCFGATQQPAEAAVSVAAAAATTTAGEEAEEAARPMFTTQPRPLGKLFSTEDSELTRRLLRESNRRRGEEEVRLQNRNRDKHAALRRQRLAHMRWRTRTAFERSLLRGEPHALAHLDAVLLAGLEETAAGGGQAGRPTCRGPVAELGRAYPELCAVRDAGRWTAALLRLLRRDALAAVERRWAGEAEAVAATGRSGAAAAAGTGRLFGRHIVHHARPVEAVSRDEHGNLLPPKQLQPPRPARLACDASVRLARRRPSSAVRPCKECHAPSWELTSQETMLELDSFDQRRT